MGSGDFMGGGLDAALARVREYRRWIEYRRHAAQASAYLDERDRAESGGRASAAPKGGDGAPPPPALPVRRSLISAGAAMTLALAAVTAISLGVSELNKAAPPDHPFAAVDPTGAAPGSLVNAPPDQGAATGREPTAPPPAATALTGAVSGAAPAGATGSGANATPTAAAGSAPAAGTPTISSSPSLLDLCSSVVAAGTGWPSVLKGAERATVIAAAGKKSNVLAYCTALVAATPTP